MACKGGKKGPKKRVMAVLLFIVSALCIDAGAATLSGPTGLYASDPMTIRLDTIVSTRYGDCVPLSGASSWSVVSMSNDTTAAGFASDSINFRVGYRTLSIFNNSQLMPDTLFSAGILVDTLTIARADTLSITGYAVKRVTFSPAVDQYLQMYVTTVTGQKKAKPQAAVLVLQRLYGAFAKQR